MAQVGTIVNFHPHDKTKVLSWLITYMLDDDWQMSVNNTSAVKVMGNNIHRYRWRMSLKQSDTRVLFDDPEDANWFAMVWKE
jgi:hypothetical protein